MVGRVSPGPTKPTALVTWGTGAAFGVLGVPVSLCKLSTDDQIDLSFKQMSHGARR
jgi:hypothetical protein